MLKFYLTFSAFFLIQLFAAAQNKGFDTSPIFHREFRRIGGQLHILYDGERLKMHLLAYLPDSYDILRWGTAATELNRQFTGMKLTNNPSGYTAYPVDANGFFIYEKRNFKAGINELWPIPQSERDINTNLTQNFGY